MATPVYGETAPYGDLDYKQDGEGGSIAPNRINRETGKSFRYAVKPDQGIGWNENKGRNWIWPEKNMSGMLIFDKNRHRRQLVLDERTGKWFEISTRNGPIGSGLVKTFLDKEGSYEGSEIATLVDLKEHLSPIEQHVLEHIESHVYYRAYKEANRNRTGFTNKGFRNAFKIKISILKDGSPTIDAEADDVPLNGDIVFDRKLEGRRLQVRIETTTSEFKMPRSNQYYLSKEKAGSRTERTMTEHGFQLELAKPIMWLSRSAPLNLDRGTGVRLTGSFFAADTGPDSRQSAMQFSVSDGLSRTIPSIAGDFSLMFAISDILVFPITVFSATTGVLLITISQVEGSIFVNIMDSLNNLSQRITWDGAGFIFLKITRDGNNITISENGNLINTLALISKVTYGGTFRILNKQAATLFDTRLYASTVSTSAFKYYVKDVQENEGKSLLPYF